MLVWILIIQPSQQTDAILIQYYADTILLPNQQTARRYPRTPNHVCSSFLVQDPASEHLLHLPATSLQVLSVYSSSLLPYPAWFYSLKRSVPQPVNTQLFLYDLTQVLYYLYFSVYPTSPLQVILFCRGITVDPARCEKFFRGTVNTWPPLNIQL